MKARLPAPLRDRICSRVVVSLKSGDAFAGVLFEADGGAMVLRDAAAIGAGENRADLPLDGELLVLVADVAYIQVP